MRSWENDCIRMQRSQEEVACGLEATQPRVILFTVLQKAELFSCVMIQHLTNDFLAKLFNQVFCIEKSIFFTFL